MNKIYKYELKIEDGPQVLQLPVHIRSFRGRVAEQHEKIMLWARIYPNYPPSKFTFYVFGTGHNIDDALDIIWLDTIIMTNGLVWHIFMENPNLNQEVYDSSKM